MFYLMKTFDIAIGHRLSKHKGMCRGLHGHNISIDVYLKSEFLNENDMVIDFKDLKKIVGNILFDYDHSMLLNPQDKELSTFLVSNDYSLFQSYTDGIKYDHTLDPTMEVLARHFYTEIGLGLRANIEVTLQKVCIWEGKDSMAGYQEDE